MGSIWINKTENEINSINLTQETSQETKTEVQTSKPVENPKSNQTNSSTNTDTKNTQNKQWNNIRLQNKNKLNTVTEGH